MINATYADPAPSSAHKCANSSQLILGKCAESQCAKLAHDLLGCWGMTDTIKTADPETLSSDLRDGVLVVSICDLFDELFGEDSYLVEYDVTCAVLREWCNVWGASYYAAPREDYDEWAGVEQAHSEGHEIVVVEDLS
jgi:hypothetical protein